jgi:ribulose-5-phosphate 4-epimerase/fuculose-1-phosphate aldolase
MHRTDDPVRAARIDLAAAHRWSAHLGLAEGIDNHLTVRVPGAADTFLLIPYGTHWSEVCASDFLDVGYDGTIRSGTGAVEPTAFFIHAPIHEQRADAACVLHTHMPYATVLTTLADMRLPMISQTAALLSGHIGYDATYAGLALDAGEGNRICRALGSEKTILFMANHGVIVIGRSIAEAMDRLYYLNRACELQHLAFSSGRAVREIEPAIVADVFTSFRDMQEDLLARGEPTSALRHFDAIKRGLRRTEPDFAG